jgi:hypothetical protein
MTRGGVTLAGERIWFVTFMQHDLGYLRSGTFRPNDQIDIAVENLEERQYLVDGLAVVRLIEESI